MNHTSGAFAHCLFKWVVSTLEEREDFSESGYNEILTLVPTARRSLISRVSPTFHAQGVSASLPPPSPQQQQHRRRFISFMASMDVYQLRRVFHAWAVTTNTTKQQMDLQMQRDRSIVDGAYSKARLFIIKRALLNLQCNCTSRSRQRCRQQQLYDVISSQSTSRKLLQ